MTDFKLLTRTFFQRFFDSELVSSAMELQQVQILALVFVAMPGFFFSASSTGMYIAVTRRMPWLLDRISWPHKLFFITYSMLVVGMAAVVVWDSLTIDRRDAMILGVLPIRARTIVSAKLASLIAFLLLVAVAVNVPAALAYAFDLTETRTLALIVRGRDARALGLRTIDDAARESAHWRAAFTSDLMNPNAGTGGPRQRTPASAPRPETAGRQGGGTPSTPEPARPTGYSELAALYGLRFPSPPQVWNPPTSYYALWEGKVDLIAGNAFAGVTLRKLDLVVLVDNRGFFAPYGDSVFTVVRSIGGQLAATIGASAWVFTTLIALQGILSLLPHRLRALCTVSFQVVFVTSLFSLFVMMPAALRASVAALEQASRGAATSVWLLPPVWFLGVHEVALGSTRPLFHALARTASVALGLSTLAATLVVVSTYQERLRASIATASGAAGKWRLVSRARDAALWVIARAPGPRAVLGFIVITLARSRAHQLLVATYTGAGVALSGGVLIHAVGAGGLASLMQLRTAVLWVPLVLFLAMLLGLRAAFRLPSELGAGWTFQFHAWEPARMYAASTRKAAVLVVIAPVVTLAFPIYAWLFGATTAAIHVAFCALMGMALLEWLFRSFDQIPFTRAHDAGQSKKSRWWWPLFIFVLEAFARWPVLAEIHMLQAPDRALIVLPLMLAALLLLQWRVRSRFASDTPLAFEVDPDTAFITLDLSGSLP